MSWAVKLDEHEFQRKFSSSYSWAVHEMDISFGFDLGPHEGLN